MSFAEALVFLCARPTFTRLLATSLDKQAKAHSYMVQMLGGMETLKCAGAERLGLEKRSNLYTDQLNVSMRQARANAYVDGIRGAVASLGPMLILTIGATSVMTDKMMLGTMLAMNSLATSLFGPLSALVHSALELQLVQSHMERIDDVLQTPVEQDRDAVKQPPRLKGHVTVKNLSFKYGEQAPLVVQDVSLEIPPGAAVALVGPSGSGRPRPAAARSSSPTRSTSARRAATSRSSCSTARRSPSSCSRPSCSATRPARSRARSSPRPACSRWRTIPALRERREDIPLLVEHFLRQLSVSSGNRDPRLPADFIARAQRHAWPGNVRELRNAVERAVLLPNHPQAAFETPPRKDQGFATVDIDVPFKQAKQKLVDEFDRRYLEALLEAHDGNISAAARAAGIERMSIYKMIRRLGLDKDEENTNRAPTADDDEDSTDHSR